MILSVKEVEDIALLARLGLAAEEIPRMQKDLSAVLNFFQELRAFAATGVPLVSPPPVVSEGRSDQAKAAQASTQALIKKNFPAAKEGFLQVRSVF